MVELVAASHNADAGTARVRRYAALWGQSNDGTGGSDPILMPVGIPNPLWAGRVLSYGKDGNTFRAREPLDNFTNNFLTPLTEGPGGIGPALFAADEIMASALMDGQELCFIPCARGGTYSFEWLPYSGLDIATLYGASMRRVISALKRPSSILQAWQIWQVESNAGTALEDENDFRTARWTKTGTTAPAANQVVEDASIGQHYVDQQFDLLSDVMGLLVEPRIGTVCTLKVRGLPGTLAAARNWIYFEANAGASRTWFDLSGAGAVGTQVASSGAVAVEGGRVACSFTYTYASGGVRIGLATADGVFAYPGDVTADVQLFDASTDVLAARFAPDWLDITTQGRIDLGLAGLRVYLMRRVATPPTVGRFYENWGAIDAAEAAYVAADPLSTLIQTPDGPWTAADKLHVAVGATASEGQRGAGANLGVAIRNDL